MMSGPQLLQRIRDKVDHPASSRELIDALKIPKHERATFRRQLKALVASGQLIETRGRHYGLPERMDLVVGTIQAHPSGFAFVVPERPLDSVQGDIYIPAHAIDEALHGDRVVARVERISDQGRAEGKIVRVLERRLTRIVGRFDIDRMGLAFVVPFDRRILMDVQIPSSETRGAVQGDMVVVEVTRWPTANRNPAGRVVDVLGPLSEPGVDLKVIIHKYGLPDTHSDEAETEARRLGQSVKPQDIAGRTDFRDWATVTIDGEHARDFDDAVSIRRLPNGHYWLAVHIADVSHYVRPGSALDREAADRGTSVYFPERAIHMFPEALATGLCSLRPNVDRLVQSCLMEIDQRGRVVRSEFHDGVIHSQARMTYTTVNQILTDRDQAVREQYEELVPTFELMHELFGVLHRRRRERGSIDFDLPEPEVILDANGLIERIMVAERNVAHRLIEEFMLVANESVARYIAQQGWSTLFRIHERPDPLKVEEFEGFLSTLGYSLVAPANAVEPRDFQRLVERIAGKPEERPIALLMLRTMQRARYDPANLGHFGLATDDYLHFTSPIRRYPDLVAHRTLRALRHGSLDEDARTEIEESLPDEARHSSEMERRADDAERELVQWKKVRFMSDKVGDEFEGFITGVAPFGLFVELVEHFVEGLVHVSSMADDYYRFIERSHELRGENTKKVYRLGDRVAVQVVRADLERRQIDFGLVDILERLRESERHRGSKTSRARPTVVTRSKGTQLGKKERGKKKTRLGRRERVVRKTGKKR